MTKVTNPLIEKLDSGSETILRSLIGGAVRTQALYVAAKLGVADHLALGPRSATDLALQAGADPGMLRRVLRFLVSNGVFREEADGRFALNRSAESLQTIHPRSLRPSAIRAGEGLWEASSRLLLAVQTGRTPHEEVHGAGFFQQITASGKAQTFGARMSSSIEGLGTAIEGLDCVKRARTIVDVGGGHGALLATLLREHPHAHGVLFDQEEMIASARPFFEDEHGAGHAVRQRCELVSGDFFESVPEGGDVYLLSWILHDWNDERAMRILRACRVAGGQNATVLIVEALLPSQAARIEEGSDDLIADPFTLDLQMLLLTGGRERTAEEYQDLLESAGYRVRAITKIPSRRGASVIEATAIETRGARSATRVSSD